MRHLIEPKDRIYVIEYILSFAKNMGTHVTKVAKNLNNKYSQKLLDTAKKSATEARKTGWNNTYFQNSSREPHSQNNEANGEIEIPKERYISPEER